MSLTSDVAKSVRDTGRSFAATAAALQMLAEAIERAGDEHLTVAALVGTADTAQLIELNGRLLKANADYEAAHKSAMHLLAINRAPGGQWPSPS
ncbi:MAG: hypothetical protein QOF48_1514 [Verrucomicrobiota bacterium]|jgi:hypothetical protein